ncbi:MAG TPA: right-handed parallel beta-helix repeat-containing protein [Candidatus Hydrogenedens sp.]|nr:right-handed parallel beta-helix repeat-containing protein [Candidatus Hydrogenedens sp.]
MNRKSLFLARIFMLGVCAFLFAGIGYLSHADEIPPQKMICVLPINDSENEVDKGTFFDTFQDALSYIKELKKNDKLPEKGIKIVLRKGEYKISDSVVFKKEHSGEEGKPIIITAENKTESTISGGIQIKNFKKLSEGNYRDRIKKEVLEKLYVADLKEYGLKSLPPLKLGGHGSLELRQKDRGYKGHTAFPYVEVFFNGEAMTLAKYPNDGFLHVAGIEGETAERLSGFSTMTNVKIKTDNCPLTSWTKEPNVLLHGYWHYDWSDSYENVAAIDPDKREIKLAHSASAYGYKAGARFYALNLLCELDQPGEWYLDRQNMLLYFYPPAPMEKAQIEFSWFEGPMFVFENASHIYVEGLHFKLSSGNLIVISEGEDIRILGCSFTHSGGYGVAIDGGKNHCVQSCDFVTLGKGGVFLRGGDRKTLTPSGFKIDNCYFYDLARVDHTYNPAVYGEGVGHVVSHNFVHKNPSSAFRMDGNDIIVEYNEVCDVVLESDDQGGLDTYGNPTYRGMIYRYNYWHHIGNWDKPGLPLQGGVRLDYPISGVKIYGNIFYKACAKDGIFGGVQVNGGKDNIIENNIFADCFIGVTFQTCTEEEWQNTVNDALNKPDIDYNLYVQRYPEMAHIYEDRNKNTVQRNIFWKCNEVMRKMETSQIIFENNLTTTDNALFPHSAQGNFEINNNILTSSNFNFDPIPFPQIGLYRDKYREVIPMETINNIRKK